MSSLLCLFIACVLVSAGTERTLDCHAGYTLSSCSDLPVFGLGSLNSGLNRPLAATHLLVSTLLTWSCKLNKLNMYKKAF